MIGIIARAGQERVIEEFFELFKTPWETYNADRAYEVVIATSNAVPNIKPRLLLLSNSSSLELDSLIGVSTLAHTGGGKLESGGEELPIYGQLSVLSHDGRDTHDLKSSVNRAGLTVEMQGTTVIRLGYDLFEEVRILLTGVQPLENARIPTLDLHIKMLRGWILDAGIPLLEIPPAPAGHSFITCLTHDIDFIGIRLHKFDRSMWGFVYRALVGSVRNLARNRMSFRQLLKNWCAVASLPLVFAGWVKDFWEPFGWYLEVEDGIPATYFLIPFKRRSGERVPGSRASLRATAYDIDDLSEWATILRDRGCELGVHGIDAWNSADKGRDERARLSNTTGEDQIGIRMHWLLRDASTFSVLEQAGFAYDSTVGYNETVGYAAGTGQVFRPIGAQKILELPLHLQDGAIFYPQRLDLSEPAAERRCREMIDHAGKQGGVLTVLWHDRSHAPERFWGSFYKNFVMALKATDCWFASCGQATSWFRKRRGVTFERAKSSSGTRVRFHAEGIEVTPSLNVRIYKPTPRASVKIDNTPVDFIDIQWDGDRTDQAEAKLNAVLSTYFPDIAVCLPL